MQPFNINVYPTYIEVPSDKYGYTPDHKNILSVAKKFVDFEYVKGQYPVAKQSFLKVSYSNNIRTFPRHALDLIVEHLTNENSTFNLKVGDHIDPLNIDIPLNPNWVERNDDQISAVQFLIDATNHMRVLQSQTGFGKSDIAIKAITEISNPTVIIVAGLLDQWVERILKNTLLEPKDVYIIKGSNSIKALVNNPEYKPKIFVISTDTLRPWLAGDSDIYSYLFTWDEFCQVYQIGVKLIDEFHLNFAINTMIDLHSRIKHNLYLSATPNRTSYNQRRIFKLIFPEFLCFGKGIYKKYVDTHFYKFELDLGVSERRMTTQKGYSHSKYESFLSKNQSQYIKWVSSVIYPLINSHYINKKKDDGEKCLLLVNTIEFAKKLVDMLSKFYRTLNVSTYLGSDSDDVLKEADIIVSTHKSAGTGTDIKNLIACGNTSSFKADNQTTQQLGRLRELKDGRTPEMFDMANMHYSAHARHSHDRISIYKDLSAKYSEHRLVV